MKRQFEDRDIGEVVKKGIGRVEQKKEGAGKADSKESGGGEGTGRMTDGAPNIKRPKVVQGAIKDTDLLEEIRMRYKAIKRVWWDMMGRGLKRRLWTTIRWQNGGTKITRRNR